MNKLYLYFDVDGMKIKRLNSPVLAEGSYKFIYAKFNFSKEWVNTSKHMLVARNNETYAIEIINNEALIEYEVTRTEGNFDLAVIGYVGETTITTVPVTVNVSGTDFKYNPAGEESRLTNDFIITSLAKIKADRDSIDQTVAELPTFINEYVADHKEELKGDRGEQGERGLQGDKGDKGDDASVTEDSIIKALGYAPAMKIHEHDDRYYTEIESDIKLGHKQDLMTEVTNEEILVILNS